MHERSQLASRQTNILNSLRAGGVLKLSPKTQRFFLIQHSRELECDQHQARRLASDGTLRPAGRDSHSNCLFALNASKPSTTTPRSAP